MANLSITSSQAGTEFEKPRGIREVEIRPGYAQVHVTGLQDLLAGRRLRALGEIAKAGVNIDFLKLEPTGFSFVAREEDAARLTEVLTGHEVVVRTSRSVVMVHAANMRDEEGLVAGLVATALASGAEIDHLSDMHDRLLIVCAGGDAASLRERLLERAAE